MDHDAARMLAKQQVEKAMRDMMCAWPLADADVRRDSFIYYLRSSLDLDAMLVERFLGHPVFWQHFEGEEPIEVAQYTLIAANKGNREIFDFAMYSNVGYELRTGACTLRRVA